MLEKDATLIDVAFAVCTVLDAAGKCAVLTGGSAATYYAPAAYQSLDADFILQFGVTRKVVDPALAAIGYHRTPYGMYAHEAIPFTVEFPAGPLRIGRDVVTEWRTDHRNDQLLHVLTPTDSARDRFIAYYAWSDYSALLAAVAVARTQAKDFDRKRFEHWARAEARADSAYDPARLDTFFALLAHRD
ncbi:MAG: hypothetical protein GIX03_14630 [Candidatus Eremiobacteraeota bacterium]|nr:hypothetical protein [Candidatus Eremiobacteraeota bacterium]MBC5804202.1 hypothetical protein [Candidatus Eremiobacteraeota bacterium]MBC5822598.1 hypothetical protein [Candidatus Eremiobacteraeota bacterium]